MGIYEMNREEFDKISEEISALPSQTKIEKLKEEADNWSRMLVNAYPDHFKNMDRARQMQNVSGYMGQQAFRALEGIPLVSISDKLLGGRLF